MGSWGLTDNAANSVSYAAGQFNKDANTANQTALFGNTTSGAIVSGAVVGQYGVSAAEMANTSGESKKVAHAGWVVRKAGTGSVLSITITAPGTGYANTDTFTVASAVANATGTIGTDASGNITSVVLTSGGSNFTSTSPTVTITTSGGTGATLTSTAGGRAGRVQYETLIAMGTITSDASDDTQLPE